MKRMCAHCSGIDAADLTYSADAAALIPNLITLNNDIQHSPIVYKAVVAVVVVANKQTNSKNNTERKNLAERCPW